MGLTRARVRIIVRQDDPMCESKASGGSIYRTPWIKSEHGQTVLEELRPGDMVTLIFSERTIFKKFRRCIRVRIRQIAMENGPAIDFH